MLSPKHSQELVKPQHLPCQFFKHLT
ncbi:UNVERIFIED_CONTAM: hypothetical protein GTU68_062637 [Idotea baltica]|nr:hypothetical protein [Idotea baltica]